MWICKLLLVAIVLSACQQKQTISTEDTSSKLDAYYTCSMHPHIKEDKPGKCPICQMNLTKVVSSLLDEEPLVATKESYRCKDYPDIISETADICPIDGTPMLKNISSMPVAEVKLRKTQLTHFHASTVAIEKMKMSKKMRVLGRVRAAEEKVSSIAARFPARVEMVYIDSLGVKVKKGDPVAKVYSPELLLAIEELKFPRLNKKAREKLLLWGITHAQIRKWRRNTPRNVTLYANTAGIVQKRQAVPGKYFKEGDNYFELADLSKVWVEMDVYEHEANHVSLGQKVDISFIALPGENKTSKIDFINPTLDIATRTLKVRTTVDNDGTLKPGMLAQATISISLPGTPLVVPTSAIIDTGLRKVVWQKQKPHSYVAKLIQTGFQSDGYSEVIDGLKEGDEIVTEGNFLLDAQAQIFGGYKL